MRLTERSTCSPWWQRTMPSGPMGWVCCILGAFWDMLVHSNDGILQSPTCNMCHVIDLEPLTQTTMAMLISVRTKYIAPAEAGLPALGVHITRLVDSYMVWVGVTDETAETVENAPQSGSLCRDWAYAMPPAAGGAVSVGGAGVAATEGLQATTLYRSTGSDVALSMAQRLGGCAGLGTGTADGVGSETDVQGGVSVGGHWGPAARHAGGDGRRKGDRGTVVVIVKLEPTLNRLGHLALSSTVLHDDAMSEPELAYMTNANDDFDLPRWQTQAHIEPLSSSAQAAQAAARASYLYAAAPPPPPPPQNIAGAQQRAHPSPASNRQPRIAHLLDQDTPQPASYLAGALNQLSRSASLGASASVATAARARRHHQPDDLEGAFNVDTATRQPPPNPLYPSGVAFHANAVSPEPYSDMYFNGTLPKRSHTQHDPTTRSGRSPMRTANALLDPYQQQAQYSPTTTPSYLYGSSSDAQRGNPPASYPAHTRAHSQSKPDPSTPPAGTPFSSQSAAQAAYAGYTLESSSPQPSSQNQTLLSAQVPIKNSASTPSTPLSFAHSQSPASQYYPQDQPMLVDPAPQHRRRASGFRRVRDSRDLRPYVNTQPAGRRVDANGAVLSVRPHFAHHASCSRGP